MSMATSHAWIKPQLRTNCQAVLEENTEGKRREDRVLIETLRPVRNGEELTYDYGITLTERITPRLKRIWECRCGAATCIGTMLRPKRKRVAASAT